MAAGGTRAVADGIYAGPGFVPFGLQAVVKFGGSLMRDVGLAARTGAELAALAREAPLLVFPGGGPSDKLVEELARQARLETDIVNPANMRALDQTGILLAAMTRGAEAVADLAAATATRARWSGRSPPASSPGWGRPAWTAASAPCWRPAGCAFVYSTGAP